MQEKLCLPRREEACLLSAEVIGWRCSYDANGLEFMVYEVCVQAGELAWRMEKRYSDFKGLEVAVVGSVDVKLPLSTTSATVAYGVAAKVLGRRRARYGEVVAGSREQALSSYAASVCEAFNSQKLSPLAEAAVLSFFGAARQLPPLTEIHSRRLPTFVKTGDLVLFRSKERVSGLQRCVTGSTWDHVAVVVESAPLAEEVHSLKLLLEATCDGVARVPIAQRVRGYEAHRVAVRRLRAPENEDPIQARDRAERVAAFAESVDGSDYAFGFKSLFDGIAKGFKGGQKKSCDKCSQGKSLSPSSSASEVTCLFCAPKKSSEPPPTFFCSQLTAHALQVAGVLRDDILTEAFWPGTFASDVDGLLAPGFSYEDDLQVDTLILDLAHSAHRAPQKTSPLALDPRASNQLKRHARRQQRHRSKEDSKKRAGDLSLLSPPPPGGLGQEQKEESNIM